MSEVRIDVHLDPSSDLARRAASDVRAIVTSRLSDDAHQGHVLDEMTSQAMEGLAQILVRGAESDDWESLAAEVLNWAGTYMGAFGLAATELLTTACILATEQPPADPIPERVEWLNRVARLAFSGLEADGRTLV